jgi:hypothetical protein
MPARKKIVMPVRKKIVKEPPSVIKLTVDGPQKATLMAAAKRSGLPLATYVRVAALEKAGMTPAIPPPR